MQPHNARQTAWHTATATNTRPLYLQIFCCWTLFDSFLRINCTYFRKLPNPSQNLMALPALPDKWYLCSSYQNIKWKPHSSNNKHAIQQCCIDLRKWVHWSLIISLVITHLCYGWRENGHTITPVNTWMCNLSPTWIFWQIRHRQTEIMPLLSMAALRHVSHCSIKLYDCCHASVACKLQPTVRVSQNMHTRAKWIIYGSQNKLSSLKQNQTTHVQTCTDI